jgi:hypothetical protein
VQLADILELAVREGVRRHIEKRAGVLLPLAVGAMVPGIVHKAIERSRSTEHKLAALPLQLALPMAQAGQTMGRGMSAAGQAASSFGSHLKGSAGGPGKPGGFLGSLGGLGAAPMAGVAGGISGGISKVLERMMLGREFGEKKDPMHMGASAAVQTFGKEMGTTGANLLRDIANKAMEAAGHAGDASAREAIIGDLKRTDSVLAGADDSTLMEAYHTMTRFAPVLSTDKNAVRSFLRQAVMSGSGPDYMSIKLLADSERAVTGGGKDRS